MQAICILGFFYTAIQLDGISGRKFADNIVKFGHSEFIIALSQYLLSSQLVCHLDVVNWRKSNLTPIFLCICLAQLVMVLSYLDLQSLSTFELEENTKKRSGKFHDFLISLIDLFLQSLDCLSSLNDRLKPFISV